MVEEMRKRGGYESESFKKFITHNPNSSSNMGIGTSYSFNMPGKLRVDEDDLALAKKIYDIAGSSSEISAAQFRALKSDKEIWDILNKEQKEYIDQAIKYAEQIEKLQEEMTYALLQTNVSEMEDAFRQWLQSGEDATDELGAYFGDVMRNALIESFIVDQLRGRLTEFHEKYKELADNDGQEGLDLTSGEAEELNKEWQEIIGWAQTEAKALQTVLGGVNAGTEAVEEQREATAKGIATASQESVDINNGLLTAIQGHTFALSQKAAEQTAQQENAPFVVLSNYAMSINQNIQMLTLNSSQALSHLAEIQANTYVLNLMCEDMRFMRSSIDDIKLKGIRLSA